MHPVPDSDLFVMCDIDRVCLSVIGGKAIFESDIVLDLAEMDLRLPVSVMTSGVFLSVFNG